jgi:hypothetical protein
MSVPPLLIQTAGSLLAILALAALAWWLKLGGAPALGDAEAVRRAANEVEDGFDAMAVVHSADGCAALARDGDGRIMVIKRHGNRFAGRILGTKAQARHRHDLGQSALEIISGEARFGSVILDIANAETWAEAINRLNETDHA